MNEEQKKCEHLEFEGNCEVTRVTSVEGGPVERYTVDVRVRCAVCRLPFSFKGVPFGLDPRMPTSGLDGLELRAPITPGPNTRDDIDHVREVHGPTTYC